MKLKVVNLANKEVSELTVSSKVFGAAIREDLMLEYIRWQRAKRRAGTAKTKTRSEISASTKKIYRQKGTGSARHGARSAPIFRGGGVVFGPVVRSFEYKLNKKVKRQALISALSLKIKNKSVVVIDSFALDEIKTSDLQKKLNDISAKKSLIIDVNIANNLALSVRNLYKYNILPACAVNVYDLLKYDNLLISVDAIKEIESKLND